MKIQNEIKCVVWDLDETLWDGVLLESPTVRLKPHIKETLSELDRRGILNSISSKNDHDTAWSKLKEFELDHFFLYPEIHWNSKSSALAKIKENLNIGMDALLFIDDQDFELDEVRSEHPNINYIHAAQSDAILNHHYLQPRFITVDSARRRRMYQDDCRRKQAEQEYKGPTDSFLASLDMKFWIHDAAEEDLQRAQELTIRTNQLNATGKTYSYEELNHYRASPNHKLWICELEDKYGSYGKIGLALLSTEDTSWKLEMMLMSCRVMSRGVGSILLNYIITEAKNNHKTLLANFTETGKNRMMFINFKFSGFFEKYKDTEGNAVLQHDGNTRQAFPEYLKIFINEKRVTSHEL